MKISGFSMCRNADEFYYPVCESIRSVLPLVDEFVIAIGKGNENDQTLKLIKAINDPKIKVIETEWEIEKYPFGTVHAQQTDLAKSYCTGDWLLYLQADEVLHEDDLLNIKAACKRYFDDERVEGFLFNYLHFWGDYNHFQNSHSWYDKEIRIIRNKTEIHSWQSAQSFRVIPDFDGKSYRDKHGTRKLNVVGLSARVFHYGWVRPPRLMTKKMNELDRIHSHKVQRFDGEMSYGDLQKLPLFSGTHPAVMKHRINKQNWETDDQIPVISPIHKHRKLSARLLSWIENSLLGGRRILSFKNYKEIHKY